MTFFQFLRSIFGAKEPPVIEPIKLPVEPVEVIVIPAAMPPSLPAPPKNNLMKPSVKCYEIIKHHEQCRLKAYKDVAGIPTIGWGTIEYENGSPVKITDIIPQFRADQLLEYEINKKARQVNNLTVKVKLQQCQFDALVSFTYNVGTGALSGSTLLRRVLANPSDPFIDNAFKMWDKVRNRKTGKLESWGGLVARRKSESYLYFNDELKWFKG